MKHTFFPVQRSVLSAEALAEQVLINYRLAEPVTCHLFQRGINDIYIVQAGESRYFLRIGPSERRSFDEQMAEVTFTKQVAEAGVPVASPVAQADGTYLQSLTAPEGVRYAVLFEDVGSGHSNELNAEQHRQAGRALAQVHKMAIEYPGPLARFHIDITHWVDEPLQLAEATFPHHEAALATMREIGESLRQAVQKLPQNRDLYGLCHGDFHSGNLLINEEGTPAIIDFDECGHSWFVYDVATYIWSHLFPEPQDPEGEIKAAFLAGYQEVRPLTELELEALPLFIALRHFWVGGLAVRQAANDGMSAISEELFTYFVYFLEQVGRMRG